MPTATAATPLPTAEQLKAYADQLPDIYRDVLSALATANPRRRYGGELPIETIVAHVLNRRRSPDGGSGYELEEVYVAVERLAKAGLLTKDEEEPYYSPTPVGEELIAALTGRRAPELRVPELPQPTW